MTEDRTTSEVRSVARHEAGHAVAEVVLRGVGAVGAVHLEAVGGAAHGRVSAGPKCARWLHRPPARAAERRRLLREEGAIRYAGVAAEWCDAPLEEALAVGCALAAVELEEAAEEADEGPENATEAACERASREVEEAFGRAPGFCVYRLVGDSAGDRRGLERIAQRCSGSRPLSRWHRPSWERACRLVRRHREALARVETKLLERRSLLGAEVEAAIRGGVGRPSGRLMRRIFG